MMLTRREALRAGLSGAAALAAGRLPGFANAPDENAARLAAWIESLRAGNPGPYRMGEVVIRVGEFSLGTPYEAGTLEAYLAGGGQPEREPLTLSLTRFDCVTHVESCLSIARCARRHGQAGWMDFAREMESFRYRRGLRRGYASRLHYFSEWIVDNARRGRVRDLGRVLGGEPDRRPLRFMSRNRDLYPALRHPEMADAIARHERSLDGRARWVVPLARIAEVGARIQTGDIVAFATSIRGLDVSHAALAYRDETGLLRVLHAPLAGGVVEVTPATLEQYTYGLRGATGIMVARPLG